MAANGHEGILQDRRICVGEIGAAHGLKGEVFVRSFTDDPRAIAGYGPLQGEPGAQMLRIRIVGEKKAALVARIVGVDDRNAAEALRGLRLYVDRAVLPEPDDDEYYHADLIGLTAEVAEDADAIPRVLGRICGVHDFGAGAILEIARDDAPPLLVPFTRMAVPEVDIAAGRVLIAALTGLIGSDENRDDAGNGAADAAGGLSP